MLSVNEKIHKVGINDKIYMLSVNYKIHMLSVNAKIHMLSVKDKMHMLFVNDTRGKQGELYSRKHNQKWDLTPGILGLQRTSCNKNTRKVHILKV